MNIRPMEAGELEAVAALVLRTFEHAVAADLSPDGVAEFRRFLSAFPERFRAGSLVWVAELEGSLVGVVEIRDGDHVSLLFVAPELQGRGIGDQLLFTALRHCSAHRSGESARITVNSSLGARSFYERHGFVVTSSEEQVSNGVRHFPMALTLGAEGTVRVR